MTWPFVPPMVFPAIASNASCAGDERRAVAGRGDADAASPPAADVQSADTARPMR